MCQMTGNFGAIMRHHTDRAAGAQYFFVHGVRKKGYVGVRAPTDLAPSPRRMRSAFTPPFS